MEYHLFLALVVIGFVVFYLSTRPHSVDISNTYQVQLSFIGLLVWVAVIYGSFNIEYILYNGAGISKTSIIDYAYIGLSLAMAIFSLLNIIILFSVGSFNRFFKLIK